MSNTLVSFGIWCTDCNPIAIGSVLVGFMGWVDDNKMHYKAYFASWGSKYWKK